MNKLGENGWRKPKLTVEGQKVFWDAQSGTYETEDMTTDNQGEMNVVLEHCRKINCTDIVTLGGAVGCRDPRAILKDIFLTQKGSNLEVVFNDLSKRQVERAQTSILKPFIDMGIKITFLSGEITDVCQHITKKPRRLLLGVYNCQSFFKAEPEEGYPFCGYDEYIRNSRILGEEFIFDWVKLSKTKKLVSVDGLYIKVSAKDNMSQSTGKATLLLENEKISKGTMSVSALQIIGQKENKSGFFLSHWYTQSGILELARSIFSPNEFSINIKHFAKGMLLIVDPINTEPQGIVTVLNNVIGNVLPQSQYKTLQAIRRIIS